MEKVHQIADLLLSIEVEMRYLAIWEEEMPSREALLSTQPFCVDTLSLTQWLQFVFIPRMKLILQEQQQLPNNCSIAPMAEEYFKTGSWEAKRSHVKQLLRLLRAVDEILSGTTVTVDSVH